MRIQSFTENELLSASKKLIVGVIAATALTSLAPATSQAGDFGIFGANTIGGAAVGALIGAASNHRDPGRGALTGAAIGAVAGTVMDNVGSYNQPSYQSSNTNYGYSEPTYYAPPPREVIVVERPRYRETYVQVVRDNHRVHEERYNVHDRHHGHDRGGWGR